MSDSSIAEFVEVNEITYGDAGNVMLDMREVVAVSTGFNGTVVLWTYRRGFVVRADYDSLAHRWRQLRSAA